MKTFHSTESTGGVTLFIFLLGVTKQWSSLQIVNQPSTLNSELHSHTDGALWRPLYVAYAAIYIVYIKSGGLEFDRNDINCLLGIYLNQGQHIKLMTG